jgi:tungstate transport system substrate-binding protein
LGRQASGQPSGLSPFTRRSDDMKHPGPLALAASLALLGAFAFASPASAAEGSKDVILATTTSTQDSGLLDALLPIFQKETGYVVKTIAVGSGQAMAMSKRGEADVLLVHSPAAEREFMEGGYGVDRRLVMHNDFILVGPPGDPAKVKGVKTSQEALKKIADAGALFLTRDDRSGTDAKEKALWKEAGLNPEGKKWYQSTGLGMGETLNVASEKGGYTLADRGTFLALSRGRKLGLEIMVQGEPRLLNVYHVIQVDPAKWPKVNVAGAKAFSDFIVSKKAQDFIARFGVEKFGSPLFFPDAGKDEKSLGL